MFKIFKTVLITIIIMTLFTTLCSAQDEPTFNDLVEKAREYDGKTLTVRGEAIGETMKRGNFDWINISDGTVPMGIWMKKEDAEKIHVFGDYKHTGDMVEVTGVFNRSCSEHGGDMDIHAVTVNIVENGYGNEKSLNKSRINISIVLTIAVSFLGILTYRRLKKSPLER
jgi:hypothetical protein